MLEKSYDVIGTVADGRQLLIEAPRLKPDVIVLDIGMPFLKGLEAAERLRLSSKVKFVFLTMKDDPLAAPASGAVGYVLEHSAVSELLKAVSEAFRVNRR